MDVISTTPFGQRPVSAGLIKRMTAARSAAPIPEFNKWDLFRELCTARKIYNLSNQTLAVLNALLSFHQKPVLTDGTPLVVYPSNKTLSERAYGMPESTLRRHIASLVRAGIIARRDSPNGKRYATKGPAPRAFGFDLRPFLVLAPEILRYSADATALAAEIKAMRTDITVIKRDLYKLATYAIQTGVDGQWNDIIETILELDKKMRRKLDKDALLRIKETLKHMLETTHTALGVTKEMSGSDIQNERHYTNSIKDSYESEEGLEETKTDPPVFPLPVVLKACPDICDYTQEPIRTWADFIHLAGFVKSMLGISPDVWDDAVKHMGAVEAACVIASMLQRAEHIKSPGGYMRTLSRKAKVGAFSTGPMIMALLNSDGQA